MSSAQGPPPRTPTEHRSPWRPPAALSGRLGLCLALALSLVLGFAFSTSEPNATGFFFDERIPLENVASILDSGSLRPRNFWYQSLSHLPQAGLLAACEQMAEWTGRESLQIRDDDGFRPLAYRLCRATTLTFGVLSVGLTFLIGRRLFSESVGVLAALLLAVLPWHLFTSARFKPDGLLLLLTLLTFAWILDVVERPTLGNFAWAGLGIGLTVATKLNGFVIAVPLALAALVEARRRPGRLMGLGLAAMTAVTVYVALNPWVGQTLATLDQNREYYSLAAEREGSGHVDVLLRSLASLVEPQFHGRLLALAVVAGALLALATALGREKTTPPPAAGRARMQALLLLSFPVAQIVINAAATERFKENHLVQIAPFTCLLAALALVELVRWPSRLDPRRPVLGTLAAVVVAGIVATAGFRGVDAVYRSLVPTTFEAAIRTVAERESAAPSPVVCVEGQPSRADHQLARNLGFVVTVLGPWEAISAPRLEACDALLFAAARMARADGPHSELVATTAEPRRLRVEGSWFERRGDDLVVLIADWRPMGERRPLSTSSTGSPYGHTVITELPGCRGSEQARSLELRVPIGNLKEAWPEEAGGALGALRWHHLGKRRPGHLLGSERIPCQGEPLVLEMSIAGTPPPGSELDLWVRGWRRGAE